MKNSGGWCLILMLFFTGCSIAPKKYGFETIYPETEHVTFRFVKMQQENGVAFIKGSLFQSPHRSLRESGHVDITVYSPAGDLIAQTTVAYQTPINPAHAWFKTGVRFLAPLPLVPPPGSTFKMAFHVDKQWLSSQEPHGVNIAR